MANNSSSSKQKRGHRGKPKTSWDNVQLGHIEAEYQILQKQKKDDAVDLSKHLVRSRRFVPSYMMATNGGAMYESILRPVGANLEGSSNETPKSEEADFLENVIGPSDDRILITDTSHIPARSIGLLEITPEFGPPRYGTAWLIGPRALATAAHNLVHPQAGAAKSMRVGLACDGVSARGGWHKITDNAFDSRWKGNMVAGSPFDFAVLKIEDASVGEKLGWFGFADFEDAKFGDLLVNVFGYPMDRKTFHMYGSVGRVRSVDDGNLFYDCDAGGGMSGGPVIARFGERRIAVGIHVAGGTNSNVGTRINDLAFKLFKSHRDW